MHISICLQLLTVLIVVKSQVAINAAKNRAQPRSVHPIYVVKIQSSSRCIQEIHEVLKGRGGYGFEKATLHGSILCKLKARAFGRLHALHAATQGQVMTRSECTAGISRRMDHNKEIEDYRSV